MILIITHKKDYTADFVINKLNLDKIPYLRLNCEDLLINPEYQISNVDQFEISFKDFSSISSIWLRRTQFPEIDLSQGERFYFNNEFKSLLENIYCSLEDKKWISNPYSIERAENKVLQLKIASNIGFNVPKTLITNSKSSLTKFYKGNQQTIIKPLHSGYVPQGGTNQLFFTTMLSDGDINSLDKFDLTPCIYQEYIEKEYELRITVVNDKVFAAKVDSQKNANSKVDWRRVKHAFKKYDLALDLEAKCIAICRRLDIKFGAIDVIKSKNGDYVFLEINPNGQWAWIEMETGLKISEAIISFLNN